MTKGILLSVIVSLIMVATAQNDQALIKQLAEEDREAIEALILYPEADREAILIAATYPEVLVRMDAMQKRTQAEFEAIIRDLPREEQEGMYNLSRYPGLLAKLTEEGQPLKRELKALADDHPEDIQDDLLDYGRSHYDYLYEIDELHKFSHHSFKVLIKDYPPVVQDAFHRLLQLPEALSILTENMNLTVLVGDVYRDDPRWVHQKIDSMLVELARKNEADIEAWKEYLEENPEARKEFMNAASTFAGEAGYEQDHYTGPVREKTIIKYVYRPYPWWFGHPYWYDYPYWYRYPYWYDWGFYYNGRHEIVIIGLPSYRFTYWYFYYPRHHYYYPQCSDAFVVYLRKAHHHYSGTYRAVNDWYYGPRNVIGTNLIQETNREKRVNTLREYGKLETELQAYNERHPKRTLTREAFYARNKNKFQTLELKSTEQRTTTPQPRVTPNREEEKRKPPLPERRAPLQKPVEVTPQKEPRPKIEQATPDEKRKVVNPQDYHRNQWERVNPQNRRVEPAPKAPPKRTAPAPKKVAPPSQQPKEAPQ